MREVFMQRIQDSIQTARSLGVKSAAGYDASSAERQGRNAEELLAMTKRGIPALEAIRAATINAGRLMSWQVEPPRPEGRRFLDYAQRYSAQVSV